MENKTINLKMVEEVAAALRELLPQMVFVGGATVSLYTDDQSSEAIRPTGDIDMTIELTSFSEWTKLQERLFQLGFSPNAEKKNICSYLYKKIDVDIIPAENSPVGKSNSWYKPGLRSVQTVKVGF